MAKKTKSTGEWGKDAAKERYGKIKGFAFGGAPQPGTMGFGAGANRRVEEAPAPGTVGGGGGFGGSRIGTAPVRPRLDRASRSAASAADIHNTREAPAPGGWQRPDHPGRGLALGRGRNQGVGPGGRWPMDNRIQRAIADRMGWADDQSTRDIPPETRGIEPEPVPGTLPAPLPHIDPHRGRQTTMISPEDRPLAAPYPGRYDGPIRDQKRGGRLKRRGREDNPEPPTGKPTKPPKDGDDPTGTKKLQPVPTGWPTTPPPPVFVRNLGYRVEGGEDPYAPRGMRVNDDYFRYYKNYNHYNNFIAEHPDAAGMRLGNRDLGALPQQKLWRIMDRRYARMQDTTGNPGPDPGTQPPPDPDPVTAMRAPAPRPPKGGLGLKRGGAVKKKDK